MCIMAEPSTALALAQAGVVEAPASVTIRFRIRDYDTMLTLRDVSGRDVLAKLGPVLDALDGMGATPNGNGHSNGNGASNGDTEAKPCPVHPGEMLRKHSNGNGAWWSHKLADGTWCKGRA